MEGPLSSARGVSMALAADRSALGPDSVMASILRWPGSGPEGGDVCDCDCDCDCECECAPWSGGIFVEEAGGSVA